MPPTRCACSKRGWGNVAGESTAGVPSWLRPFPGIVLRLDAQGTITDSNGRAEAALAHDVAGLDMTAILDRGSSSAKWSTMLERQRAGAPPATWELVLACDATLPEPRKFSFLPDPDAGGWWLVEHPEDARVADARTGVMDVNAELVETQRALVRERSRVARVMQELERSNAALDEFAHVVSHDLKAPLRSIINYAKWTVEDLGGSLSGDAAEHLANLQAQVVRMQRLIDGVLSFARAGRQRSEPEAVDVAGVVREVVQMLAPPPGVRIVADDELPAIVTERVPLQQVLYNLVANAIAHGGAGVTVRVTAARRGDEVEFAVADDGPGVPAESRDRIWRLFDTAGSGDGTGIGLAVVKRLVEDRGGGIWLDPDAARGATFRFTWPLHRGARATG
jgi:signal transduction histidine kinase